ncbi:MAG: phosphodiester glycosidase family protein [Rhodobacter sp.]|nr:phosphodiester glycosidase family protein [Rhodobacter sp.]
MRWIAAWLFLAVPAMAVTCEDVTFRDQSFTACRVDARIEALRLFHTDRNGEIYGSFDAVEGAPDVETLSFAMNAGMFHEDRSPVGLYIENGKLVRDIVTREGPGNFGLLPNGLLCITDTSARVIESLRYVAEQPDCRDATQSGPMLVIDGALHPRFLPDGTSRLIRNGVGTSDDYGIAVFVISNEPVSFHEFASFFRDHLGLNQALYLDGNVSRLYAPQLGRSDFGMQLGPIVGVID